MTISDTGRQIRVTIPVPVFNRIERTAAALGTTVNELGTRCVVEGIGPAIVARIGELEQSLAALKTEIAPTVKKPASKPAKVDPVPAPLVRQGRAEKAAAVRAAELAEERLRGNRRTRKEPTA